MTLGWTALGDRMIPSWAEAGFPTGIDPCTAGLRACASHSMWWKHSRSILAFQAGDHAPRERMDCARKLGTPEGLACHPEVPCDCHRRCPSGTSGCRRWIRRREAWIDPAQVPFVLVSWAPWIRRPGIHLS